MPKVKRKESSLSRSMMTKMVARLSVLHKRNSMTLMRKKKRKPKLKVQLKRPLKYSQNKKQLLLTRRKKRKKKKLYKTNQLKN